MATETSNDITNRVFNSGRIWYVDPNNVNGTINGVPLTPDYTDMCISFDLKVETVPRTGYVCGEKSNVFNGDNGQLETYHFYWTSYKENANPDDNVVSFMKGEDYLDTSFLTTYYTDISLNDFAKHDIVEGLGVESVSVSFESYYVPTVKIRFIDVRGASLFGRQEATHIHEKITQDSIWGCFFTFPYPKFRLQIKGFYGHPVTYQLTCTDFRATFNSKTGNFEIDVTFLGYDYGILADIPTAYLISAPFSKYVGEDYWNQHVASEEWRLSDGTQPQKLFTVLGNIKSAMRIAKSTENGDAISDGTDGTEDANKLLKKNILDNVITAYNDIELNIKRKFYTSQDSPYNLYKFVLNDNLYYLFTAQEKGFWRNISETTSKFYQQLDSFRINYPSDNTELKDENMPFGRKIKKNEPIGSTSIKSNNEILSNRLRGNTNLGLKKKSYEEQSGVTKTYEISDNEWQVFVGTNFTEDTPIRFLTENTGDISKYVNGKFVKLDPDKWSSVKLGSPKGYQIIPMGKVEKNSEGEWVPVFTRMQTQYESYIENKKAEAVQEQAETDSYLSRLSIYQMLELTPTIENVFKTIMCHLETFMAMMYSCKEKIDKQITAGDRTPQKLGISDFNFTDANAQTVSVNGVPPWVGVAVNEKKRGNGIYDSVNTVGWIGDFNGETQWEEEKLIDGLSIATLHVLSENNEVNPFSYRSTASVVTLPSDVFTDVFPSAATNNPYALGEYLGIRAAALFGVVGIEASDAESFGKADALNLFLKVGKNHLRKNLTNWNDFTSVVKNAPATPNTDNGQFGNRVYTFNPGCEEQKAQILTLDNGNYRYTYTERIGERSNNMKPVEGYSMGMVPVVEGNINTIMGSDATNATFICNKYDGDSYMDIWARYLPEGNGKVGRIYHNGKSEQLINNNGLQEDSDKYQNDVMFNIYNGGVNPSYSKFFTDTREKLDQETFTVENYEDKDTVWRETLKKYWDVQSNKDYLIKDINVKNYRWKARHEGLNSNLKSEQGFINIFNSPLFYQQNVLNDKTTREAAKCILFLSTGGYGINTIFNIFRYGKHEYIFQEVPYGAMLLVGGLLWRAQQDKDCIVFDGTSYKPFGDYKKYATVSKTNFGIYKKNWLTFLSNTQGTNDYVMYEMNIKETFDINVKNKLIKEFEWFLNNKWETIRAKYEETNSESTGVTTNYNFTTYQQHIEDEIENDADAFNNKLDTVNSLMSNDSDITALDSKVYLVWGTRNNQAESQNANVVFSKQAWEAYADAFCSKLIEISKTEETVSDNSAPIEEKNKEVDLKLAMYMYLKRLWDRWFMTTTLDNFKVENYMQHFIFMDSLYRNIGDILHINCEKLYNNLSNINGKSMLYQLLSSITTDHNCHFFAFPDYFGFGDDEKAHKNAKQPQLSPEEKIADLFKPIPFSRKDAMETSNKYVVVLIYNQNENLSDLNDYKYDGFDIFSNDGTPNILPATFTTDAIDEAQFGDAPMEERRIRRYGYKIPSFGVTFGRMDNSIFKTVNINMANPIATEQSINALSLIAEKGGSDKSVCFYGQDLYPVYNGYSYTCSVEMMGNAQIMPLMYFQLLNIPMFRGTYMIYSVTHTMRPGDMTTTFQGMKLSRNALPFAQGWYTTPRLFVSNSGTLSTLLTEDLCNQYGNGDYKLDTTAKAMKISDNKGVTRSPIKDSYMELNGWQTGITVTVHTDTFTNGIQDTKTITFKCNKNLKQQLEKIYQEIFNTVVDGKYFAVVQTYGYSDKPTERRLIRNKKYPNSNILSWHAYGAAVDINWEVNPFNKNASGTDDWKIMRTESHPVVQIFKKYGWGWGGSYGDWMHFSYFGGK